MTNRSEIPRGTPAPPPTTFDRVSPWAGAGAPVARGHTRPLEGVHIAFSQRVQITFARFLEGLVGSLAGLWVSEEVRERGEPHDLVSALALGHALVMRITDPNVREHARVGVEAALSGIKRTSEIPPAY
jgi:hypothetical protein